jgi:hypothetical protein
MDDREPVEPSLEPTDGKSTDPRDDEERLPDGNYVGEDNIREGRVGGVIGGPHQQGGEGQGG